MKKPIETVSENKRLIAEWDFDANKAIGLFPDNTSSRSNKDAFWKCKYGHKWKAKINNRFYGRGCPRCTKRLRTSFPEQAVFFYVRSIFPDAINSFKDVFDNGMELDVYIPSIKTGIEYDGINWHKDSDIERERRKYFVCKDNGITLIRLKENNEHYHNSSSLNVADHIILVSRPFSGSKWRYSFLDGAIKTLLAYLGDADISVYFDKDNFIKSLAETFLGPKVLTDVNCYRDKNIILENYLTTIEGNSLGSLYPDIASKWHPTKNGFLTPFMFSPHTNKMAWWKGECGHEWESSIGRMTRKAGCPYCTGQKVLKGFNDLETCFPKIAKEWHPVLNKNKTPDMYTKGSGHKAHWLCQTCGQHWEAAINNRTSNNRGCPYCSHLKPIKGVNDLVTVRPDLMLDWDYDKNKKIDPTELMEKSNVRVSWKCHVCGYEYKTLVSNRSAGTGCKRCAGDVLEVGKNDFETLYPEIAKEWDYELNGSTKPSGIFAKTNDKYFWKCNKNHSWQASPNARARGRGCPYCSGNKVLEGFNDLLTTHPEIAKEWHPTKNGSLKPTQVSRGRKKPVWFLCPQCETSYKSTISNKIKGFGRCPKCSTKRKSRAKLVELVEKGQKFKTLKEAALSIGVKDYSNIAAACVGKIKTAYGFHWRYIENPEEYDK